jgi:ABC-type transporter Mla subunit MlaD
MRFNLGAFQGEQIRPRVEQRGIQSGLARYGDAGDVDAAQLVAAVTSLSALVRQQQGKLAAFEQAINALNANNQKLADFCNKLAASSATLDGKLTTVARAASGIALQQRAMLSGVAPAYVPRAADMVVASPTPPEIIAGTSSDSYSTEPGPSMQPGEPSSSQFRPNDNVDGDDVLSGSYEDALFHGLDGDDE